jgi:hypothetical protein
VVGEVKRRVEQGEEEDDEGRWGEEGESGRGERERGREGERERGRELVLGDIFVF